MLMAKRVRRNAPIVISLGGRGGTIAVRRPFAARCDAMTVDELRHEALGLDHAARAKLAHDSYSTASTIFPRERSSSCGCKRPFAATMLSSPVRSRPFQATG